MDSIGSDGRIAPMGHFKDLKAWQHARALAVLSNAAIARLPESEKDGLANQWKRASYSVALNIAEGASRRGSKEFRRFLDIARASLHEIEAILELVLALDYFRPEELAKVQAVREECAKTVYGLLRKLSDAPKQSVR
ncbi:MAG: four helix bundle protein [Gemmatimonadetes bacterium]|nr:MAG: four helix bundle protein [Gemmatimonadota bacterium]PYP10350.1 MAG: four helix bundle protein [Gemmatimonadota bacterium]PYP74530.1 MAG: four helix bundle protein [Gemmatimonadota bacterium]